MSLSVLTAVSTTLWKQKTFSTWKKNVHICRNFKVQKLKGDSLSSDVLNHQMTIIQTNLMAFRIKGVVNYPILIGHYLSKQLVKLLRLFFVVLKQQEKALPPTLVSRLITLLTTNHMQLLLLLLLSRYRKSWKSLRLRHFGSRSGLQHYEGLQQRRDQWMWLWRKGPESTDPWQMGMGRMFRRHQIWWHFQQRIRRCARGSRVGGKPHESA